MKKLFFGIVVCLCVMAASHALAQGLPDTGQTKCYDNTVEIPCPQPSEAFYGQDAEYVKARSYIVLGNGIVRDNTTGLEWIQDGNLMVSRDPDFDSDGVVGPEQALDYIDLLNAEEYLGYADWRLPSRKELSMLVDSGRFDPAIDPIFSARSYSYISSDAFTFYGFNIPWLVSFYDGRVFLEDKYNYGGFVRAVRGTPFANNLIDNGDGTITDTATGLMWQQTPGPESTWQQALAYCDDLDLAGYTDWRLPDRNELQSISPELSPFHTSSDYCWSSTKYAYNPVNAWVAMSIWVGEVGASSSTFLHGVRAVRSGQYVLLGDLGYLCIEDYHCDEGDLCVEGECQTEVDDNPPALGDGPYVAAGVWPVLSASSESPTYLTQNYSVLWTFSDDFGSCSGDCTHSAEYQVLGSDTWTPLSVSSDAAQGYAWVDLPITGLQNATTYAFRFAVTDCASQTTESNTYYFRVATSDAPPAITGGPWLAAGSWPVLPTSSSRAFVLDQNYNVLWTFSDDYASCLGLCTHRARYRKVGDTVWTWIPVSADPTGKQYAYTELPVSSLETGTYQFYFDVRDCAGQLTKAPKVYYFKVE